MVAVVVFGILFGYLILSALVTYAVVRHSKRVGESATYQRFKGMATGALFLLMPLWDAIPSWVVYKRACKDQAILVENETAEAWRRRNANAVPLLRENVLAKTVRVGEFRRIPLNQRVHYEWSPEEAVFLSIRRQESRLIDVEDEAILVKVTDFRMGTPFMSSMTEGWKVWLRSDSCLVGAERVSDKFLAYREKLTKGGDRNVR